MEEVPGVPTGVIRTEDLPSMEDWDADMVEYMAQP